MLGLPLVAVVVDMLGMSRKREFELSVVDVRVYAQCLVWIPATLTMLPVAVQLQVSSESRPGLASALR
jgi:hypothetical protein